MTILLVLMIAISLIACSKKQDNTRTAMNQAESLMTPALTMTPAPSIFPTHSMTPSPTMTTPDSTPSVTILPKITGSPTENANLESKNKLIAIDAGHQSKGNNEKEPFGPGASITKPKVSSGTRGVATDVPEYKLNLAIALKVKEELIYRGYDIYMIRETNDVNLSNRERAEMANESGADVFIRIHADGSENSSVSGISTLYPSENNSYVAYLSENSYALSKAIVDAMCDRTGARNRGAIARDDMSGINWCSIPVSIIEMGYMSNKREDELMQTEEYQDKMVQGICDGIDAYYNE